MGEMWIKGVGGGFYNYIKRGRKYRITLNKKIQLLMCEDSNKLEVKKTR